MFEVRSLFVDTFGAYNGGSTARYNSIGYYTAQGAEACDATWVEIDSMPNTAPFADVDAYVRELNTPVADLTPEELAEEWAHENANATFPAEVPTQAPEEYRVITNVGAHPIHTSTYTTLADARACLKARRVNCPGAGTYHFILDSEGYIVPLIPLKPSP